MRIILSAGLAAMLTSAAPAAGIKEIEAAEALLQTLSEGLPLTQRVAVFVAEESNGYGMYHERENAVFARGEPILTYVEPVGYGWTALPEGLFEMAFDVDLKVLESDGGVIDEQASFLQYRQQSRRKNTELSMDLTLTFNGAPAGKYAVEYTIHDKSSGESSTFRQDFEIAE